MVINCRRVTFFRHMVWYVVNFSLSPFFPILLKNEWKLTFIQKNIWQFGKICVLVYFDTKKWKFCKIGQLFLRVSFSVQRKFLSIERIIFTEKSIANEKWNWSTPLKAEILCVQNMGAFVVCGFSIRSEKKCM